MDNLREALRYVDWALLAKQKERLVDYARMTQDQEDDDSLDGILNFLDAIQDAAALDGFPVIWVGGE